MEVFKKGGRNKKMRWLNVREKREKKWREGRVEMEQGSGRQIKWGRRRVEEKGNTTWQMRQRGHRKEGDIHPQEQTTLNSKPGTSSAK